MSSYWTGFKPGYIDIDWEPFTIDVATSILRDAGIDPERRIMSPGVDMADASESEAEPVSYRLVQIVAFRLNLAARSFKLLDAEAARPTHQELVKRIDEASEALRCLIETLIGEADAERGVRPHPAISRLLFTARAAATGKSVPVPEDYVARDLEALLILKRDVDLIAELLDHPDNASELEVTQGDMALNAFFASVGDIWEGLVGRKATISVSSGTRSTEAGRPGGPFFRFLRQCVRRLPGQSLATDHAIHNRWKTAQETAPRIF